MHDLPCGSLRIPAEERPHQSCHFLDGFGSPMRCLYRDAGSPGEKVIEVQRPFVGGAVDDLGPQMRSIVDDSLAQAGVDPDQLGEVTDEGSVPSE